MKKSIFVLVFCVGWIGLCQAQNPTSEGYEPGEGLILTNKNDYSIRFSGFIQPMVESRFYPDMAGTNDFQRFRMRRLVTKLTGDAGNEKISYQLQVDLTGNSDAGGDGTGSNYLMDAWIAWKPIKQLEITVGQDNSPTDSREMGMLSNALQLVDRSPVALAFASIREFGIFVNGRLKVGNNSTILPSFALTNGDGSNVFTKDRGGLKVGGRIDFLPFGNFNNKGQYRQVDMERELTPKLIFGANFSHNTGISDRRGRQSGTILYLDSAGKELLPSYQKFGIDFLFKYKGFSMLGEYVNASAIVPDQIAQRVRNDGSSTPSFLVDGIEDMPAYVKGRMILGSGFNLQAGYLFLNGFSVDARYSKLNPETNSFLRNPTFYNRPESYTLCLTKYLGRNYGAKIQASVSYNKAETGTSTVIGTPLVGNEFTGLLMLTLAL